MPQVTNLLTQPERSRREVKVLQESANPTAGHPPATSPRKPSRIEQGGTLKHTLFRHRQLSAGAIPAVGTNIKIDDNENKSRTVVRHLRLPHKTTRASVCLQADAGTRATAGHSGDYTRQRHTLQRLRLQRGGVHAVGSSGLQLPPGEEMGAAVVDDRGNRRMVTTHWGSPRKGI